MSFIPKPFVFESMISATTKVYLPGQEISSFAADGFSANLNAYFCVHLCNQFSSYPVLGPGIRSIPTDATCPFGGWCHGARIMMGGKPTNKSIDMNYAYISKKELKTR